MTRNNLNEHLSWLLNTLPSIPSTQDASTLPPEAEDVSDYIFDSSSNLPLSNITVEGRLPTSLKPSTNVAQSPASVKKARRSAEDPGLSAPSLTVDSPRKLGDKRESMARLQAGPKPVTKARLMSQYTPQQLATPAASTIPDKTTSLARSYNAQFPRQAQDSPSRAQRLPIEYSQKHSWSQVDRAETIDLTADDVDIHNSSSSTTETFGEQQAFWTEDSGSRPGPPLTKGTKRKSDEFDNRSEPSPRRQRPPSYVKIKHGREREKVSHVLDEEPPQYSEVSGITKLSETTYSCKPPSPQEHDKGLRELNVRTSSHDSISFNDRSQLSGQESNSAHSMHRLDLFIPDSDEEDAYLEQTGISNRQRILTPAPPHRQNEGSNLKSPLRSRSPLQVEIVNDAVKPHREDCKQEQLQHQGRQESIIKVERPRSTSPIKERSIASPFQKDSPTKIPISDKDLALKAVEQSENIRQDITGNLLTCFLKEPTGILLATLATLESEIKASAGRITQLMDDELPYEHLRLERKFLIARKEQLSRLSVLRIEYASLRERHEMLKHDIIKSMDAGLDFSNQDLQRKLVKESILQYESYIKDVLLVSGYPFSAVDSGKERDAAAFSTDNTYPQLKVFVKSTQAQSQAKSGLYAASKDILSSDSAHTQMIWQTQISGSLPGTSLQDEDNGSPSLDIVNQKYTPIAMDKPWEETDIDVKRLSKIGAGRPPSANCRTGETSPPSIKKSKSREVSPISSIITSGPHPASPSVSTKSIKHYRPTPGCRVNGKEDSDTQYGQSISIGDEIGGLGFTHARPTLGKTHTDNFRDDDGDNYLDDDEDVEMLEVPDNAEHDPSFSETEQRGVGFGSLPHVSFGPPSKTAPMKWVQNDPFMSSPPSATLMQHSWSKDVKTVLKDCFHLRGFRKNQLEAINATLAGKDVFVLMPTGGGKSLCYQLPSIIRSGNTGGVTVVISPLLSLMRDQVDHLQKLRIQAFLYNGEVTAEHKRLVMEALRYSDPEKYIQLLYITPEMISKSDTMVNLLKDLHRRKKFARIVIDEAHCVSQWGHDFRPDYKALGEVRRQFPGVPAMALTATATENVKLDVIHNLNIKGCDVYTQSFNRPNLTYEVRPKGTPKDVMDSMVDTIQSSYRHQTGIIYALSRKTCESLAEKLRSQYKVKAHHYHAGMDPAEKNEVQKNWQSGKYHVIVATIAFGMGIDKPDVRFVMHHQIPKSLEGYYQETGRAGRDGKKSGCYLFYSYKDSGALKRMIDEGDGDFNQKERQHQLLKNVIQFCENKSDCRRVQVLAYFNERFDRADCKGGCDNCNSNSEYETQDFTDLATSAIKMVRQIQRDKVTFNHCIDVFRGSKNKKVVEFNHNRLQEYGMASNLPRTDTERLFNQLMMDDALRERNEINKAGFANQYVHLGHNSGSYSNGRRRLKLQVRISPHAPKKVGVKRGTGVGAAREECPSTNVSSPVQQLSRRRKERNLKDLQDLKLHPNGYEDDGFVVDDKPGYSEDSEDHFNPIRNVSKPSKRAGAKLGPPITEDQRMNELGDTHRYFIDHFLAEAKAECERLRNLKGLRVVPFTDTILREMAIRWISNDAEMLEIPDVDPTRVNMYGKYFYRIVNKVRADYEVALRMDDENSDEEDRHDEDAIDQHAQNVVNLCSEDDLESGSEGQDLDDADALEENSRYFNSSTGALASEVRGFNERMASAANQKSSSSKPARAISPSRPHKFGRGLRGSGRSGLRGGLFKRKGGGKRSSGASAGSGTSKEKDRKKARNSGGSGSTPASLFAARTGAGSGIGMMPT